MSVAYMAQRLGVTPTYYRTIEAGQNVIGAGSVQGLISTFVSRRVYIDFSSLAALLLGITILDKYLIHHVGSSDPSLALGDFPDFKRLLTETAPYLSGKRESAEQRSFLKTEVYNAVRHFLETSPGERNHGYSYLSLDGVSPRGIQILHNMHRELVGRHFIGEIL